MVKKIVVYQNTIAKGDLIHLWLDLHWEPLEYNRWNLVFEDYPSLKLFSFLDLRQIKHNIERQWNFCQSWLEMISLCLLNCSHADCWTNLVIHFQERYFQFFYSTHGLQEVCIGRRPGTTNTVIYKLVPGSYTQKKRVKEMGVRRGWKESAHE